MEKSMYRIWSRVWASWWGKNAAGYTTDPHLAGQFTKKETERHCGRNWRGGVKRRGRSDVPVII